MKLNEIDQEISIVDYNRVLNQVKTKSDFGKEAGNVASQLSGLWDGGARSLFKFNQVLGKYDTNIESLIKKGYEDIDNA